MTSLNRSTATLLLALAAGTTLSACAPLLIGGAIWGGTLVVSDRRTSGAQIDDQAIELKSVRRIADVIGDKGHVNVTSYNRLVLLSGEVPTEGDKAAVEQAVARIDNVRAIVNELTLAAPSSLSARSNDTLMTSKVKASMVDAKDIQANAYKVVTERSVVYLMGRVTEREANRAADIARGVSGVQKVVKVFDVVSEGELADTQPKTLAKP
jgi:osmotically-inducible protein OsmY